MFILRVTENMDIIIDFIDTLIEKGFAYESEGDVYYRTSKFEGYGKLSHQSIDELQVGARIEVGEKKEDPLILLFGKQRKKEKSSGKVLGEKDVQVGILNARRWQGSI